jgi:hypothetical protein
MLLFCILAARNIITKYTKYNCNKISILKINSKKANNNPSMKNVGKKKVNLLCSGYQLFNIGLAIPNLCT